MESKNETPDAALLPRNQIFDHPLEQKFLAWYRKIFSIREIEDNKILWWAFGASLLTYLVSFSNYAQSHLTTKESFINGTYLCWSYFQNCGDFYFLSNLPYGYSQPTLYMVFFGFMVLIVFLMHKKDWVLAHMLMSVLFIWKFFFTFFLTGGGGGNFNYFDIVFSIILLFLPYKTFFLKLAFVTLYFLASTIKIHEGWILGSYFTALKSGLPLFPDALAPILTNLVIFMQMVGSWFLLSKNKLLQRTALVYFLCFHFYSGVIVYYRYPISMIPMLLILFGPMFTPEKPPLTKRAVTSWILIALLVVWQLVPYTVQGDQKMTLEANRFGLYMFEANHQCISQVQIHYTNGETDEFLRESLSSRERCDPFRSWFKAQLICDRYDNIDHISWQFDHSINGNPFYRIVDETDVCNLEYKTLQHNDWIKLPADNPELIGYPVENYYFYGVW